MFAFTDQCLQKMNLEQKKRAIEKEKRKRSKAQP